MADLLPLVEQLCDAALLLDSEGAICKVAAFSEELPRDLLKSWGGKTLEEVVLEGDRPRVREALQ